MAVGDAAAVFGQVMALNLAVAITILIPLDNDDTAIGTMAVQHPPLELGKIMTSHLLMAVTRAVVFGFNDHNAAIWTMAMPLASVELREIMPSDLGVTVLLNPDDEALRSLRRGDNGSGRGADHS